MSMYSVLKLFQCLGDQDMIDVTHERSWPCSEHHSCSIVHLHLDGLAFATFVATASFEIWIPASTATTHCITASGTTQRTICHPTDMRICHSIDRRIVSVARECEFCHIHAVKSNFQNSSPCNWCVLNLPLHNNTVLHDSRHLPIGHSFWCC